MCLTLGFFFDIIVIVLSRAELVLLFRLQTKRYWYEFIGQVNVLSVSHEAEMKEGCCFSGIEHHLCL